VGTSSRASFLGSVIHRRTYKKLSIIESTYGPGEQLPQHFHAEAFVSVALQGSYSENCGARTHECGPGEAIFHPENECHADCFYQPGGRLLNIEIHSGFLASLESGDFEIRTRTQLRNPHILQIALRLQREMGRRDLASDLATEGLALELLAELLREGHSRSPRREPEWLDRVREILHDRCCEPLTLGELAQSADVHPVYLARAFRKRNNCSIGDYIRQLRVAAACRELSASTLPLPEIAAKTGFSDQSHLSRTLKRHTGMSPHQFRQRMMISVG
jgi:AraC family transcriptional regulator